MSPKRLFNAQVGHDVAWYLENYTPAPDKVSEAVWRVIRAVVIGLVAEAVPLNPMEAKYMVSPTAQYIAWCYELGFDLADVRLVLAPSQIDRWIDSRKGFIKQGARADYRLALRRMAAANNPNFGDDRGLSIPRDNVAKPYSQDELIALNAWARCQPEGPRRANAPLLIALVRGAGLTAQPLRFLRGSDVEVSDRGVIIHVGGDEPRLVPVLRQFENLIADAARDRGEGYLFQPGSTARSKNMVTAFVSNCVESDAPRLSIQRLRVNWIVWHLDNNTPVVALTKAAGSSLAGLGAYERYCRPIDEVRAIASLRGVAS